jgi:uncharacterized membrane protein YwaF
MSDDEAHDKYMFFSILYIIGIALVLGILIPNVTRDPPPLMKILTWVLAIIVVIAITILRVYIYKRDHKKDIQKN